MIKQKRSKVKQAILPFILERTYELSLPDACLSADRAGRYFVGDNSGVLS